MNSQAPQLTLYKRSKSREKNIPIIAAVAVMRNCSLNSSVDQRIDRRGDISENGFLVTSDWSQTLYRALTTAQLPTARPRCFIGVALASQSRVTTALE